MITNIDFKTIDKHRSVLIIGISGTNKYLGEVVQPRNRTEARNVFSEGDFFRAFETLADMIGDQNVYLMNIDSLRGLLVSANLAASCHFAYIVPIGINISEKFHDPLDGMRRTYYLQALLRAITMNAAKTVVIMSDAHASLYEDIDNFLDDMNEKREQIQAFRKSNDDFGATIFVANNLVDIPWANIVLAGMIVGTSPNEYPATTESLQSVFHIDFTDNIGDMAYFVTHPDGSTTVENLLTMHPDAVPEKIFTIYRICIYVAKELDFSNYIGSKYAAYKKREVGRIVEAYLASIVKYLISDYELLEVAAFPDPGAVGCVRIRVKYRIQPIGCVERGIIRTVETP